MKTEHKHAQVLRWIADGESVEGRRTGFQGFQPWAEFPHHFNERLVSQALLGDEQWEFRLKPCTITVNGREVQAPETVAPTGAFFCADPFKENFYSPDSWSGADQEQVWLERGLVHLTKEAAISHAKAMLNID